MISKEAQLNMILIDPVTKRNFVSNRHQDKAIEYASKCILLLLKQPGKRNKLTQK